MTISKEYNYMDWWTGEISLIYSTLYVSIDDKETPPIRVSWDEIKETDVPRIKEKQKEIFNRAVTELLENWKEVFLKRHTNSQLQGILLDNEWDKFMNIILEPMPKDVYEKLVYNEVYFDYSSLSAVKKYITDTKKNGFTFDYDSVHSPHYPHQKNGNIPEVYAECCWRYAKWLEEFQSGLGNDTNLSAKEDLGKTETNEPENPYPLILKNGYAYKLFLELRESLVVKDTELADYSFIYQKMKHGGLQAIHPSVRHKDYIRFVNEKFDASITSPKLTNTQPAKKEKLYNSVFMKYRGLI